MINQVKKLVRPTFYSFINNRYIRIIFAYYIYRRWIAHSEAAVALHRREKRLDESYWVGKIREYAHIVDKGLHRGDFTKGHGISAYKLAKSASTHIKSAQFRQDPSIVWAIRKIKQYEDFQSGKLTGLNSEYVKTTCKYDELLNAVQTRRCIRHYLHKPVDEEAIHKITDMLDWSPSSCNHQPSRVYATNNPDIVRQCVELHRGAACFTDIYAPLFLTFCADSRVYGMPNEVFAPFIDVA